MKFLKTMVMLAIICAPVLSQAQSRSSRSETTYHKKTSSRKVSTDTSDLGTILKDSSNAETGPILNDNGSISTTGTIDGRSSTGRPDADSTTSYTVKRTKRTIRTGGAVMPDTTKRKRSRP
jgi:hypothetical protein